jgi:hypothetical protein
MTPFGLNYCNTFNFPPEKMEKVLKNLSEDDIKYLLNSCMEQYAIDVSETKGEVLHG